MITFLPQKQMVQFQLTITMTTSLILIGKTNTIISLVLINVYRFPSTKPYREQITCGNSFVGYFQVFVFLLLHSLWLSTIDTFLQFLFLSMCLKPTQRTHSATCAPHIPNWLTTTNGHSLYRIGKTNSSKLADCQRWIMSEQKGKDDARSSGGSRIRWPRREFPQSMIFLYYVFPIMRCCCNFLPHKYLYYTICIDICNPKLELNSLQSYTYDTKIKQYIFWHEICTELMT